METVFYATGIENLDNGKTREHRYTVSASDPAPEGHEITDLRVARVARVSSVLSPESIANLNAATSKR